MKVSAALRPGQWRPSHGPHLVQTARYLLVERTDQLHPHPAAKHNAGTAKVLDTVHQQSPIPFPPWKFLCVKAPACGPNVPGQKASGAAKY